MNDTPIDGTDDSEFDRLETEFIARLREANRRKTRRHRWIAGATALVIAVGAGTAWIVLANQHLRERAAYCYSAADPTSRFATIAATDETTPSTAVDTCAELWRIGFFDRSTPPSDGDTPEPVPRLQACLRPDGVIAVFPNREASEHSPDDLRDLCERLGLESDG